MDQILTQILDACRQAQDLDRALGLSAVHLDPRYLLASCEDLAAAFHHAASALRARVLSFESPREEEQVAQQGAAGPSLLLSPLRREWSSERRPSKKRKEGAVTKTVPAMRIGDAVVPLDDGYTWRKYGQKDIHNSKFPRSYYRCTHKSFYGCGAKKQVQRLDDDPSTFEVTYRGDHTCQTSTTPLLIPAITVDVENRGPGDGEVPSVQSHPQAMAGPSSSQPQFQNWLGGENRGPVDGEGLSAQLQLQAVAGPSSSQPQFPSWLGGENRGSGDGEDTSAQLHLQAMAGTPSSQPQVHSWLGGVGSGQAAAAAGQGGGRDVDVSVAELADAMFNNPGSSGNSSMDAIFSPKRGN